MFDPRMRAGAAGEEQTRALTRRTGRTTGWRGRTGG